MISGVEESDAQRSPALVQASARTVPTDPAMRRRYDAIMSVLTQTQTVTAAAESLDMSRNHFQTDPGSRAGGDDRGV